MRDAESALFVHLHPDERPEARRLIDIARSVRAHGTWRLTAFVDPRGREIADLVAGTLAVGAVFFGGDGEAERVRALFVPKGMEEDVARDPETFELGLVDVTWNSAFGTLEHRDVLGAVLGLGIERERVGDIRLTSGRAEIVTTAALAPFVVEHLKRVGVIGVAVRPGNWSERLPHFSSPKQEKIVSVASMRLDAVIAEALQLSREAAKKLVHGGAVKVNHRPVDAPDAKLALGDLVSVRGFGRLEIVSLLGRSQKGRIRLAVAFTGARR